MQEVDCEDPGCLGPKELPPGRTRGGGERGAENLPHGGRPDRHAEFHQFAVDPAVPPQRILPRQANDKACNAWDRRRAAGLAPRARVVFLRGQPAVPSQERRGRHGEHCNPAPARHAPCQRGEPHPVGRLVPHPASAPAQHRVLTPEHQQLSILRLVATAQQDDQAEHPTRQHVGDLEQHPASQAPPHPARRRQRRSTTPIEYSSGTGRIRRRAGQSAQAAGHGCGRAG